MVPARREFRGAGGVAAPDLVDVPTVAVPPAFMENAGQAAFHADLVGVDALVADGGLDA